MSAIQRRPPPPPIKFRKSTQLSPTSSNTSSTPTINNSTINQNETENSSTTSHSHRNTPKPAKTPPPKSHKSPKMPPKRPVSPINHNKHKPKRSRQKIEHTKTKTKPKTKTKTPKRNSQKPPPVPQHLLDKYKKKQNNNKPKTKKKQIELLNKVIKQNKNNKKRAVAVSKRSSLTLQKRKHKNTISYSETTNNIDAAAFNSLLLTQDIETYRVIFCTLVCGIELIPFDRDSNLGAVVVKCHTDFSKKKVILQSLIVSINGQVCIDTDYDSILQIISHSTRPLKLTFHPPTLNKNDMIDEFSNTNNRLDDNKFDDVDDDADYNTDPVQFIEPQVLFNQKNEKELQTIQRSYTMLYHKYIELLQFEKLTAQTVHDKMNEVSRLNKENIKLKTMLYKKEAELQRIEINKSNENKKIHSIMDKYRKINEKNIEMEKENILQKQTIQELEYELKQSKIFIRQFKRTQKNNNKPIHKGNNENKEKKKVRKHKKSLSHKMDNKLQNELRSKLGSYSVTSMKTPPPARDHHRRRDYNTNKRKPAAIPCIALHTPEYGCENDTEYRSKSTDIKPSKKKRQSAIGLLFKNFTKKKDPNRKRANSKYHPQIEKIVNKRNKRNVKKNKHKVDDTNAKAIQAGQRARSNSLESNLGRTRQETIV